jgi:putative transposase
MGKREYKGNLKLLCVKAIIKKYFSYNYVSELYGVPKSNIHFWYKSYKKYGVEFTIPKKRGPREKEINNSFINLVIKTWYENKMGSKKLKSLFDNEGFDVSQRQIQKILNKNDLILSDRKRPWQIKYVKFERSEKNELWHVDWTTCPFTKKQLIAFIDDYSRFIVHAEYFENATAENTILAFQNAILKFGKPKEILSDNGVQFTAKYHSKNLTIFEKFCSENDIKHILGRVHHPQTNGKIERWFGTYKKEYDERFNNLNDYIHFYNEKRIHQSLNYQVPAQRYLDNFKRCSIITV